MKCQHTGKVKTWYHTFNTCISYQLLTCWLWGWGYSVEMRYQITYHIRLGATLYTFCSFQETHHCDARKNITSMCNGTGNRKPITQYHATVKIGACCWATCKVITIQFCLTHDKTKCMWQGKHTKPESNLICELPGLLSRVTQYPWMMTKRENGIFVWVHIWAAICS